MALTEETVIDKIEILEDGTMQIREATYVLRDGVRTYGPAYHRRVLRTTETAARETGRVKAVAELIVPAEDREKAVEPVVRGRRTRSRA